MPFVTPTDEIVATLTDVGRANIARSLLPAEGLSFVLTTFKVGRGGYLDANPVKVLLVDPAATDLIDPVFTGNFQSIETIIAPNVVAPICRLDVGDTAADFGLGELGIYATVLASNDSGEIGTSFLFALAHFPLLAKTPSHTLVWRVIIAL